MPSVWRVKFRFRLLHKMKDDIAPAYDVIWLMNSRDEFGKHRGRIISSKSPNDSAGQFS